MAKRQLLGCAIGLLICQSALADFKWFNSTSNPITYWGSTNRLFGTNFNPSISCFVQLIYAGTNQVNDPAINSGNGVTGDDVVLLTGWIGSSLNQRGVVVGSVYTGDTPGQRFYVRVWSAPALNYTNGLVPTSPTNRYGDSAVFTNPCPTCLVPFESQINFGGPTGFAASIRPTFADTDGDGIPDWWESEHFGGPTNAPAHVDDDGDGFSNYQEFIAGTQPTNAASLLVITSIEQGTNDAVVIRWSSANDRTYTVRRGTNVLNAFPSLAGGLPASAPENAYTDTVTVATSHFYSVEVAY